jgi:predicted membrane channel-forming protein YqfA (hemolysin III family)
MFHVANPCFVPRFSSPEYRPARAVLFVCLGGFGLIPATHFILQSGLTAAMVNIFGNKKR